MPANAKPLNHGQGCVIGPQWPNIGLILNDILLPLRPIPFYSQRYCREQALTYRSEQALVVDDLEQCELEAALGADDRRAGIVLTDSGYADTKSQQAIAATQWQFRMAFNKTRSVNSQRLYLTTPQAKQWGGLATFFRHHRGRQWKTLGIATPGPQRKRREWRIRDTIGSLRYVGQVQWVGAERRKRPEGRRKYVACNAMHVTARQLLTGDRLRWAVELFQKQTKQHLGFEDVAIRGFDAVISHGHWVYCAYILLHLSPPGGWAEGKSVGDKQRQLQQALDHKEKRRVLQKLSQLGGVQRSKNELRQALADA